MSLSFIYAASDAGGNIDGSSQAPEAIKKFINNDFKKIKNIDIAFLSIQKYFEIYQQYSQDMSKYKNFEDFIYYNQEIYHVFKRELDTYQKPILIGGDHSLSIGSIVATQQHCIENDKQLLVLWFDAHTDCHTLQSSQSKNTHGMPVSFLFGDGFPFMTINEPLTKENLYQIGIRSIDENEKNYIEKNNMNIFSSIEIKNKGVSNIISQIFQQVEKSLKNKNKLIEDLHLHISFDVDVLDPIYAPGVSTPVENGLDLKDVFYLIDEIKKYKSIDSMDLMELNPKEDKNSKTIESSVQILKKILID